MRIALGQINATVGDIAGNLTKCLRAVASSREADVLVLPELALTGYPPEDLLARPDFIERTKRALADFAASTELPAVIGYVERTESGLRNAAAFVRGRRVEAGYYKRLLPNYG